MPATNGCGRLSRQHVAPDVSYLDVARDNGFDGVLTISNQITASSSESPVDVSMGGSSGERVCGTSPGGEC
jgi:hypothetical protein